MSLSAALICSRWSDNVVHHILRLPHFVTFFANSFHSRLSSFRRPLFEFPPLCSVLAVLFVIEVDAFDGMSPFTPSANVKPLLYRCELATGGVKARWGGYG